MRDVGWDGSLIGTDECSWLISESKALHVFKVANNAWQVLTKTRSSIDTSLSC